MKAHLTYPCRLSITIVELTVTIWTKIERKSQLLTFTCVGLQNNINRKALYYGS
jgi:hypothetical protein